MSYPIDFNSSEFRKTRSDSYELARSLLTNSPDDVQIYGLVVDSCFAYENEYRKKKNSDLKYASSAYASYFGFKDALSEFNRSLLKK